MLFFGLLDAVYAFSLFNPEASVRASAQLSFIQDVAPLSVWAAMWAFGAVICLACAFRDKDRWGFTVAMLIKVMWGALYVHGALAGVERAYLGAVIWLCLAGWVAVIASWPEPPELRAED